MLIVNAIESYLTSSNVKEDSGKEHKFYLSDMGKYMRMRYFKRLGIQTEFPLHVSWILKMGDLIHDFGYKVLESQGLLIEAEDYVETDHFIGRFDGLVKCKDKKAVFDFKSLNGYKMKRIVDGEEDEDSISQLLSYVMLLQKDRKDISDTAFVVYLNKEPGDKKGLIPLPFFQREYHLTTWRTKQLREEMDTLVDLWKKDKVPACSCPVWMKPYNSFQPLCQMKEEDAERIVKQIKDGKKFLTTKDTLYLKDGEERKVVVKL